VHFNEINFDEAEYAWWMRQVGTRNFFAEEINIQPPHQPPFNVIVISARAPAAALKANARFKRAAVAH
jgi:hypothetical protein